MEKKRDFVFGAFILASSGFIIKIIGALFRIPLTNLVGSEAMGYYSSAYSVYEFLLALAASGTPTGIAVIISRSLALGKKGDVRGTLRISASIFVSLGFLLSLLGIVFARPIAVFMNSEKAYPAMLALMPAVFFISVVALFKGYFQGYDNMLPSAISNLIEASVKLCAGLGVASYLSLKGYTPEIVIGGAIAGITFSTFCAMSFMGLRYLFRGKPYRITLTGADGESSPLSVLAKDYFLTAFPIMISAVASNLMGLVDSFVVMNRLKSYFPVSTANQLWGAYGNMTLTIFNLPSFLIISIGTALVPGIASAFAKDDFDRVKDLIDRAMRLTAILSFACAFGINATAEPLLRIFFVEEEGISKATGLLQIISFVLISVGFTNITAAVLNSVKKAHLSVISVAVGAVTKSLFTFLLMSFPSINITGAPIATNIAYPVMVIMNIIFIYRYVGVLPSVRDVLIKPFVAGVGCYVSAMLFRSLFERFTSSKYAIFPVILLTAIVYLFIIIALRIVSFSEIKEVFHIKTSKKR